jgi:hypothetical protein
MAAEANLEVFADYFQIYLADPFVEDDWSDAWQAPSVLADRFIVRPRILGFCTERNSMVPLRVVSHESAPELSGQLARADHAVLAGLSTAARRLIVAGCTEYWPSAFSLGARPGLYSAAFLSFELASVRGLEGNDRYELHIWPVTEKPKSEVLVRWSPRYAAGAAERLLASGADRAAGVCVKPISYFDETR